jgi:Na+-driven multidrug efflux pump
MSLPSTMRRVPSFATLLALAWPVVLSRAAQAVIGFCDAVMVAPYGEDAVAATTTGALNSFNAFIFPMGVVFIVQSFASQLAGAGDREGARRYGWYGLLIALATAVFAGVAMPLVPGIVARLDYTPRSARCSATISCCASCRAARWWAPRRCRTGTAASATRASRCS